MIKKRILAMALSVACAVSSLSMATVGAEGADKVKLGALEAGAKLISYVDFAKALPANVTMTDDVEIEDGEAIFTDDGENSVVFAESLFTEAFKKAEKLVIEMAIKPEVINKDHRIIGSMGYDKNAPHIVMGMRKEDDNGAHDAAKYNDTWTANNTFNENEWYNLKFVLGYKGCEIYLDGELAASKMSDVLDIQNLEGDMVFGHYTVNQWADPNFIGRMSEIRISTIGEGGHDVPTEYPTEPCIIDTLDTNLEIVDNMEGTLNSYAFTDLVPGVYKLAYCLDVTSIEGKSECRVCPYMRGFSTHRSWLNFTSGELLDGMSEAGMPDSYGKIIYTAVFTLPEGCNMITPGAFFGNENQFEATIDKVILATKDYDFARVDGYTWVAEKGYTAGDSPEDAGAEMVADDEEWTPSTRRSNNNAIKSVTVDGVAATRTGDTFSVKFDAAKASYKVDVVTEDPKASVKVAADYKTITVTSEAGEPKVYTLDIQLPAPKPDPKPGDNNNVNKPADNKKPAASKKASVKKITIKQGKKTVKTIKIKLKKKTIRLKAVVTGKNLTKAYKKISWTTSKKKIATVSSKGVVKLKKKGTVKITAKNKKSGKKATVKIIIKK